MGGAPAFYGAAPTLRVHEDNASVRTVLSTPGDGRVLVIDGGGSVRVALVGGKYVRDLPASARHVRASFSQRWCPVPVQREARTLR